MDQERKRLLEDKEKTKYWKRWGPYLSARQWGTVREDYSEDGDAWDYLSYDMARSKAYRWGEDGIGGISDNHQRLCFAISLWNRQDDHIKERFFGLTPSQGNHGEDVKELYYYLDNTPTHSYMKMLYKYPQSAFPYEKLLEENKKRGEKDPEFEIYDAGVFKDNNYFDVFIEYAKDGPEDLYIRITIENRSSEAKPLDLLPTLWARNTWDWGEKTEKPTLKKEGFTCQIEIPSFGKYTLYGEETPTLLFTENETDRKNKINDAIIKKTPLDATTGTKMAFHYSLEIPAKSQKVIHLRLSNQLNLKTPFKSATSIFEKRINEADLFYKPLIPSSLPDDCKRIQRQAYAGMLWSKQFYHYVIEQWLDGDPPTLPLRKNVRNAHWKHVYSKDVLSMPDKWEYPWFAVWDSSFQMIVMSMIDPEFAKRQLTVLTREWYMNPNGQLPAYEWNFADVNPPVHAWATWRVFKIEGKNTKKPDFHFLERVFQKLIMNFTWWVNRKDAAGKNIFQGGFLGMDNISIFNRSEHLPKDGILYQSDATSWMGFYCLQMLTMALELAKKSTSYEDIASKFYLHFLHIADAINYTTEESCPLWNEEDGFYYDVFRTSDGNSYPLKVRSMVGLIPLLAVATIEPETLEQFKGFKGRMDWFINHRGDLCEKVACMQTPGENGRRILSILDKEHLSKILTKLFDEKEFLSPYGIRSISKYHENNPFTLELDGHSYSVDYEPAESTIPLFGGNSNWRGPIWFPINMLLIESLQKFHHYYGDSLKVEFPTGSGNWVNLWEASIQLSHRLLNLFLKDSSGHRPIYAQREQFQNDPHFQDYILYNEYFNGDTGEGLGASHQTGWTGLIAKLIKQLGEYA